MLDLPLEQQPVFATLAWAMRLVDHPRYLIDLRVERRLLDFADLLLDLESLVALLLRLLRLHSLVVELVEIVQASVLSLLAMLGVFTSFLCGI